MQTGVCECNNDKTLATAWHMTGRTLKSWRNKAPREKVFQAQAECRSCNAKAMQRTCSAKQGKARQRQGKAMQRQCKAGTTWGVHRDCCQSMHASSACNCLAVQHKCVAQQRAEGYHHGHLVKRGLPVEQHDISILQMPLHLVTWLQVDVAILAPVAQVKALPILPDDEASPSLARRRVGTILHQLLQPAAALPWTDNRRLESSSLQFQYYGLHERQGSCVVDRVGCRLCPSQQNQGFWK